MSVSRLSVGLSVCPAVYLCRCGNPASRWNGDFWSQSVTLILAYLKTFSGFCHFNDLWKSKQGEGLWLLVLVTGDTQHLTHDFLFLTFSVCFCCFGIGATIHTQRERDSVSRMRNFFFNHCLFLLIALASFSRWKKRMLGRRRERWLFRGVGK